MLTRLGPCSGGEMMSEGEGLEVEDVEMLAGGQQGIPSYLVKKNRYDNIMSDVHFESPC